MVELTYRWRKPASFDTIGYMGKRIVPCLSCALTALALIVVLSPFIALVLPDPWSRHMYHEISFQLIAGNELPETRSPDAIIQSAIDYTRRHLWLFDSQNPYSGKPFDYLVEGVGWCDYHAKVFCRLLAARGLHARYVFLKDQNGISPHTVAEVFISDQWRAVDPFFNLTYSRHDGEHATLETLTPGFVTALLAVVGQDATARAALPDLASCRS